MANYPLPDPRMENPAIFLPGKPPIGPVAIDLDHQFLRKNNLIAAWVFAHGLTDLISGLEIIKTGSGVTINNGRLNFDAGTNYAYIPAADSPIKNRSKYTIATRANTFGTDEMILSVFGQSGGSTDMQLYHSTNKCLWRPANTSSNVDAYTSGIQNVPISHVCVQNAGAAGVHYTMRNRQHKTTTGTGTSALVPANKFLIGVDADSIGSGGDGSLGNYMEGWIEYLYVFDNAMPQASAKSLNINPYQFLIPA